MKLFRFLAALVAMFAALPASAALFVSGDSNIFNNITTFAPNQQFLKNISGSNVLIQNTTVPFLTTQAGDISTYLTSQSITNTVLGSGSVLSAANFVGRSLFIAFGPADAYSGSEVAAMNAFLGGGGSILFTGENNDPSFATTNNAINAALTALGSGMQIVPDLIDPGFNTANIITANTYTAGTAGFQYAATSRVSGGTALYGTLTGNQPFLSCENCRAVTPTVPEPATWGMMLLGFGIVGGALRRRSGQLALI